METDGISRSELDAALAQVELRIEKRLGVLEATVAELRALSIQRNGPVVEELRNFEQRTTALESLIASFRETGRAEIEAIARKVAEEEAGASRDIRDYLMRGALFLISVGTLVFVTRGGK